MVTINITGQSGTDSASNGAPVEGSAMPATRLANAANGRGSSTATSPLTAAAQRDVRESAFAYRLKQASLKAEQRIEDQKLKILTRFNTNLQKRFDAEDRLYQRADREDFARDQRIERNYLTQKERILKKFNQGLQRESERQGRRFDRDYIAANAENSRRDYNAMRYDAEQENNLRSQAASRPSFSQTFANNAANHSHRGVSFVGKMARGYLSGGAAEDAEGMLGAALGPIGIAAAAATVLGYEGLKLPGYIANESDRDVASASLYMQMRNQAAALGRMGGFAHGDLESMIYGPDRLGMMGRYGYTPQDVMDIYGAYGNRGDDSGTIADIAAAAGQANLSRDLGGLGAQTYAGWLGRMSDISQNFATGPMGSSTAGGASSLDPAYSATDAYFRKLQQVMQAATMYGLDHSSVGNTLMQAMTTRANSGASNINVSDSANILNRLLASGSPAMRDGSGVMSFTQALDSSAQSAGYGGNTSQSMAFLSYSQSHGGLPKTMSALEKQWNFNYGTATPYQRMYANQALAAARSGDMLGYTTAVGYLADQATTLTADESWLSKFHLSPVQYSYALGSMVGGYSNAVAVESEPNAVLPSSSGLNGSKGGPGMIPKGVMAALLVASQKTGVPLADLEALAGTESTWGTNIPRGTGGALQLTPIALQQLKDEKKIPQSWTMADMDDPNKSATAGALYYADMLSASSGSTRLAASHYNAGPTHFSPGYASTFMQNLGIATGNDPDAMNDLQQQNQLIAQAGQFDMRASNGGYDRLSAIFAGASGQVIESLDNAAGRFQDGSTAFAGTVKQFAAAVAKLVASGTGGKQSERPTWHGIQPVTP